MEKSQIIGTHQDQGNDALFEWFHALVIGYHKITGYKKFHMKTAHQWYASNLLLLHEKLYDTDHWIVWLKATPWFQRIILHVSWGDMGKKKKKKILAFMGYSC